MVSNEKTEEVNATGIDRTEENNDLVAVSEKKDKIKKNMFSAKRVAVMAIFIALSFIISFIEITVFPQAEFLKLDFGNVFIMLIGFLFGPIEGLLVCIGKELLRLFMTKTGGVGELANILVTSSYILVPAIAYKFHKGLKVVIPALLIGCALATGMAVVANRYILMPAFGIPDPSSYFASIWGFIVGFNMIKTVSISITTLILYKRLSLFLKKMKI